MLINEITKSAVKTAIENAGKLDRDRFEAQQARRILDRLVGYQISPLLWRKIQTGLSAGRVQSVAVRLICEREQEIRAFKSEEYWSIEGTFKGTSSEQFSAKLIEHNGQKLKIANQAEAEKIEQGLKGLSYTVSKVEKKERQKRPPEPFITARLQQESAKRLGFPAKKTMSIAQQLYEGIELGPEGRVGLITYMRTDSVRVSEQAIEQVRAKIKELFGENYLPKTPNLYRSKKGAQEAHEAIRPTILDHQPEKIKQYLTPDQFKLYRLIYERFLASQMLPAIYDQTIIEIKALGYLFRASGSVVKFLGFLIIWQEAEKAEENGDEAKTLPELKIGDALTLLEIIKKQHFTEPPPRFNEASLIRELEEKGIGRPSTYAQIVSTIQERKYVEKNRGAFYPTPLGFMVNDILIRSFPDLVNVKFTAQMEDQLDQVEEGKLKWVDLLKKFYAQFSEELKRAPETIDQLKAETPTDLLCPQCGKELMIRWGKKGEFLACSGYPDCKFTSPVVRGENGEIQILEKKESGLNCPNCGNPLIIRKGKNGEFLGCSSYPKCKFTSNFIKTETGEIQLKEKVFSKTPSETGISCEKCGKPMVIKTKGKRKFLACSGYPNCKNIKNYQLDEQGKIQVLESTKTAHPKSRQCPNCGKKLVIKRGKYGPFLACSGYPECKYTEPLKKEKTSAESK